MSDRIVIVGAGFSGTLLAINMLRSEGPPITLIEREPFAGTGLAYGAAHPSHLLNVRAANMSAFHDEPGHFREWVAGQGLDLGPNPFVPRLTYGRYLRDLLAAAVAGSGGRLTLVQGEAVRIARTAEGARVDLADGTSIAGGTAVLSVGNLPPHAPPGIDEDALPRSAYAGDPWAADALEGLGDDAVVLALGTGLTMVDVALALRARGFGGRIVAMSRRGLLPHSHADAPPAPDKLNEKPRETGAALVRRIRRRAAAIGWRAAIDELRPFTQDMWRGASDLGRARFLQHARPWWDIHRHRLAPDVAAIIAGMRESGALQPRAGKTLAVEPVAGGAAVTWRPRGSDTPETLVATRIINCTGPQGDLLRADEPLLRALVAEGAIRPDPLRIGIDVDLQSRTIAADGTCNDWLYALGPMTRGAFWEIVAVPDIRVQSWSIARRLTNSQWVGGEGL